MAPFAGGGEVIGLDCFSRGLRWGHQGFFGDFGEFIVIAVGPVICLFESLGRFTGGRGNRGDSGIARGTAGRVWGERVRIVVAGSTWGCLGRGRDERLLGSLRLGPRIVHDCRSFPGFRLLIPEEEVAAFCLGFLTCIDYSLASYTNKTCGGDHLHHRPWLTPPLLVLKRSAGRRGSQLHCQTPSAKRPLSGTFLPAPVYGPRPLWYMLKITE